MLKNKKINQAGFVILRVLIALLILGSAGFYIHRQNLKNSIPLPTQIAASMTPSPTPTPSPVPTPRPTIRPAPAVTRNPSTPTPQSSAAASCSQFKPADGLATIRINLKEKDGQALSGDWIVKIKPTGSCPGMLPPMWGSQINEVIHQPNYTYTSPGLHPGQFRVDVQYHVSGEGFNWDGTSGSHSHETTVSN